MTQKKGFKPTITLKYIQRLSRNKRNGFNFKTKKNTELQKDLDLILEELKSTLLKKSSNYTMKWLIGLEKYIHALNIKPKKDTELTPHLRRGAIINVELFGHFNTELTFKHPAVVLFDKKDRILVAPVSSSFFNNDSNLKDLYIDVGINEGFANDCGISLADIYMVNKNRIVSTVKNNLGNAARVPSYTLDKIDSIITNNFISKHDNEIEELKSEKEFLKQEILDLEQKKIELEQEIKKLRN